MTIDDIETWSERIRERYESYLKTSFYFKDDSLRRSFEKALQAEVSLLKGPFPEAHQKFATGNRAHEIAAKCFRDDQAEDLLAGLMDGLLYTHQEKAIDIAYNQQESLVVATGTASGKTECFLYPILFELYRQHLAGELVNSGVRAMILYPMNALANDQRGRLGQICRDLQASGSAFCPTFGQYTGLTPKNSRDHQRKAKAREADRLPGELIYRDEMQDSPPHILLTNYSMLEYLLMRPDASPLFDKGRGKYWQYIVLDEAHQYRGAKGMEMGMLMRRLKERLRDGGRERKFQCIATSATITSQHNGAQKEAVAEFASELFGEHIRSKSIVFGESISPKENMTPRRYHAFLRALEGAFLVHENGEDVVVLNRKCESKEGATIVPLEIALCRECGQHYYVGQEREKKLVEAIRDISNSRFGVDYYLHSLEGEMFLCRACGKLSKEVECECDASIRVKKCENHEDKVDQLKQCEVCGYGRGGVGDPVREIVHNTDDPNTVIAISLHELLPESRRKILAFSDSRQDAAFFAWYAQDSFEKTRDRNYMLRAIRAGTVSEEGLSIEDLKNRSLHEWKGAGLLNDKPTAEEKANHVLKSILREVLGDEKRRSLAGVGLVKWSVDLPAYLTVPEFMRKMPWNFSEIEARLLISHLLAEMRLRRAMNLPSGAATPQWEDISPWPQQAYCLAPPGKRRNVQRWGGPQSSIVKHFLRRILAKSGLKDDQKISESTDLMSAVWEFLLGHTGDTLLMPADKDGTFRLNPVSLRVKQVKHDDLCGLWECDTCATLESHNIRNVCPRNLCPGTLVPSCPERLKENYYRQLYLDRELPSRLDAEEHTAQIGSEEAHMRQDRFKSGKIHLLSSSTTFEVGVDLGDLDVVFLRNVPPESYNYTQRAGRSGRRDSPGLVLTYCRRNPHDLYHYEDPISRVVNGSIHPPRLRMTNEKIILRHMVAVALSAFFKRHATRFESLEAFVGSWSDPEATGSLVSFCKGNGDLRVALCNIIPPAVQCKIGLDDDEWIDQIAGKGSRLALAEAEVCADYTDMEDLLAKAVEQKEFKAADRIERRKNTIASEKVLSFLSRKAIIPKYGFPVDVVELDIRLGDDRKADISLQRDLSRAIAEYAPGGKVVANKREWESCGIKSVPGKTWPVYHYHYDKTHSFKRWTEGDKSRPNSARKYLIPQFGFVTPLFEKSKEPQAYTKRFYTTRPFFRGFDVVPDSEEILGVRMTKAVPGVLVILCEGKQQRGFYICRSCGRHMSERSARHNNPFGSECGGTLEKFSLGHELETDVIRLEFPMLKDEWQAYSVAYAVLLGAAETLDVPHTDLNITITQGQNTGDSAIVLYDNVPGGAGLVAQLQDEQTFSRVLEASRRRVEGNCGCGLSCYGCLRSYRNQFAHAHLNRIEALKILTR